MDYGRGNMALILVKILLSHYFWFLWCTKLAYFSKFGLIYISYIFFYFNFCTEGTEASLL